MNLSYFISAWKSEHADLLATAQRHRTAAYAIADRYRAGRVCCEGRCCCDLAIEGTPEDILCHDSLHEAANALMMQAFKLSRRIYRAERILASRQVPSPRIPQVNLQEAA